MRTPGIFVGGLGTFVPETTTVEDAVEQGLYPAEDIAMHQLGGAAIAGDLPAPEMALRAAQDAMKRGGHEPHDLNLLLYVPTWHQGPEGWMPHSYLQRYLVGGNVRAVEVRQGCNGMFAALELAAGHLLADDDHTGALIVAADNYGTPLLDRWRSNLGFVLGDAASAVVLTKRPGIAQLLSVCALTAPEAEEVHRGGEPLFPPSITLGQELDFAARINYHLQEQTPVIAALAEAQELMPAVAQQAMSEAGVEIDDITKVAFMNYSREVVEQRCMAPLGLPMSRSTWEFGRNLGHCGASDHLLALEHVIRTGELVAGDHLLWLAMGPGVEFASAVFRVLGEPADA